VSGYRPKLTPGQVLAALEHPVSRAGAFMLARALAVETRLYRTDEALALAIASAALRQQRAEKPRG